MNPKLLKSQTQHNAKSTTFSLCSFFNTTSSFFVQQANEKLLKARVHLDSTTYQQAGNCPFEISPLLWWQSHKDKFPHLAKYAHIKFTSQSSSVHSESKHTTSSGRCHTTEVYGVTQNIWIVREEPGEMLDSRGR